MDRVGTEQKKIANFVDIRFWRLSCHKKERL